MLNKNDIFFFAYSALRSIPNESEGVIISFISIFISFLLSLSDNNKIKNLKFLLCTKLSDPLLQQFTMTRDLI